MLYCPKCPARYCCQVADTEEGCPVDFAEKILGQIPEILSEAGKKDTAEEGLSYVYNLLNDEEYNTAATILILSFEGEERCELLVESALKAE